MKNEGKGGGEGKEGGGSGVAKRKCGKYYYFTALHRKHHPKPNLT